jgi:hypothetical protein
MQSTTFATMCSDLILANKGLQNGPFTYCQQRIRKLDRLQGQEKLRRLSEDSHRWDDSRVAWMCLKIVGLDYPQQTA